MKMLTVASGAAQRLSAARSKLMQMRERDFQETCKYFESWFGEAVTGHGRHGMVEFILNMRPVSEPGGLLDFIDETLTVAAKMKTLKTTDVATAALHRANSRVEAGWWEDLSPEARKKYIQDHPNSKYAHKSVKGPAKKDPKLEEIRKFMKTDKVTKGPKGATLLPDKPAPKKPDPTGLKDPMKSPSYRKALKEYEDYQKKNGKKKAPAKKK